KNNRHTASWRRLPLKRQAQLTTPTEAGKSTNRGESVVDGELPAGAHGCLSAPQPALAVNGDDWSPPRCHAGLGRRHKLSLPLERQAASRTRPPHLDTST